ncbi:MAG: Smr/MutS family protein [Bacteroidales bacterium]|nr:Smr/MutS family protein [Bacteroidales bacterium]
MKQIMTTLEEKLGFDKIRALVAEECTNEMALQMAQEMSFTDNYEKVVRQLRETEEMRQLILMENGFPQQDFYDLSGELQRIRMVGTVIDLQALPDLKASLRTLASILRFLLDDEKGERSNKYSSLQQLARRVEINFSLLKTLDKLIDEKGELFDDASPELLDIRRQMQRKRGEVDMQIIRSLNKAKQQGWAPEDAEPTIRHGRLVIPLLDTHRRKIKGIIQDESASRQTAFLEPAEVVELNNDLRELEFAERREIQRILAGLTESIRPQLPQLLNAYYFLASVDFLRAKARLALKLRAVMPLVHAAPKLQWMDARHPLLFMGKGEEVVPFGMTLSSEAFILIISGPNAGGKSVCLKAVGLIQYMLQCGMLVPCRETSEFGIFGSIFIDIGDQQSIENDLSTYSSHLQSMKKLLETANGRTLFLLDELGGGTEPRSGCAIAEAVLEELYRRRSFGVATTHFADLKLMADRYEGIRNGAMLFDTERMQPLYRLAIGHPGSSFAFEMATNIGLPTTILEEAEKKVGGQMLNFEHQLQQLELDKQEVERQRQELNATDDFLNEVVQKYQRLTEQLEEKRFAILSKAREEAKQIIGDANRAVERTIGEIRSSQAEKAATQQARERLEQTARQLQQDQQHHADQRQRQRETAKGSATESSRPQHDDDSAQGPIAEGDIVRIDNQQTYAQVVQIKGKKAIVENNNLRLTIPLNRLMRTNKQRIPADGVARRETRFQSVYDDLNEKRSAFNPTLDVRGHRAEEAVAELQRFIDEARLLGEKELRVLHGKGYGILKTILRKELQRNPEVASFHSERLELGGEGITVAELK